RGGGDHRGRGRGRAGLTRRDCRTRQRAYAAGNADRAAYDADAAARARHPRRRVLRRVPQPDARPYLSRRACRLAASGFPSSAGRVATRRFSTSPSRSHTSCRSRCHQLRSEPVTLVVSYLYLTAAIVFEVIGTVALKASDTFTRLVP